jgi:hypothetical protein
MRGMGDFNSETSELQSVGKQEWVLKKSLNRTPFHLRACGCRLFCLCSTKWWRVEPVF